MPTTEPEPRTGRRWLLVVAVVALAVTAVLFLALPEELAWVTAIAAGAAGGAIGTYLIGAKK